MYFALRAPAADQNAPGVLSNQGSEPNTLFPRIRKGHNLKSPAMRGFLGYGGERGIRTLEALRLTRFPGELLQPLGHLTKLFYRPFVLGVHTAPGPYFKGRNSTQEA